MEPFWPRRSPDFLTCRRAVRQMPERPVVIGLSGGADSLALVAAAAAERRDVLAVVVDHGLQPGSGDVAERAAAQATAWGVDATVVSVSVAPGNVEASARAARYEALLSFGREVWVAHTMDDQAETLLLGALRGNPSGMSTAGRVARPFLGLRRADTVGACAELGVEPWSDPMNQDRSYRRVALRHEIIPALSRLVGGDCVPALAATAERIARDRELLSEAICSTPTSSCEVLAALVPAARRRRIVAWLHENDLQVGSAQLDAIERLVTNWHGQGAVAVGGGKGVARRGAELHVVRAGRQPDGDAQRGKI